MCPTVLLPPRVRCACMSVIGYLAPYLILRSLNCWAGRRTHPGDYCPNMCLISWIYLLRPPIIYVTPLFVFFLFPFRLVDGRGGGGAFVRRRQRHEVTGRPPGGLDTHQPGIHLPAKATEKNSLWVSLGPASDGFRFIQ